MKPASARRSEIRAGSALVNFEREPSEPLVDGGLELAPVRTQVDTADQRSRNERRSLFGRNWYLVAPAMLLAMVVSALITGARPPSLSILLALGGIAIAASSLVLRRFEPRLADRHGAQIAVLCVIVGLPSLLFGLSLDVWKAGDHRFSWDALIGTIVVVNAIASILLNGRMLADVIAKIAMWVGVALMIGEPGPYLGLGFGAVLGIRIAIRQFQHDQRRDQDRRANLRTQARAEEILAEYEQTGQGWFWETDRKGNLLYLSQTVARTLDRDPEALVGTHFSELFFLDSAEGERTLTFHLSTRSSFKELAVRAASQSEERWWSISGRPIYDTFNNYIGFRGSGTDLTERRRSEENATRLAHYDSLTGLANRFQMSQTLEKILTAQRIEQRACSVFLLDLDRFKQVNDTMGHPVGDALLKQVAERLQHTVDKYGRVGRLGGDEFQVIIPGPNPREPLAALAKRIIANLSQPYQIEGHRIIIGASIGIARSPDDGSTSEALIRNADLALYAAKDGGRGRHHFYAADLHSDAEERRQLEQDLRDALSTGGLALHYQPVVQTVTERITGFEALLRWTHPTRGPMSPAKFIPIAEDAGLIAPIGEWALRQACEDLARFPPSVRVAVNVSTLQFANPNLPAIVTNALAASQVDPSRLELEITESVFLTDSDGTDAMFAALKRVGVRLALDDFGTGYSSLGYLKKAPFDKIKIDQSFVRGATQRGSRNGAIIASIVSLAEALGMETTAEGVETLDELDLVRMLGCSHIQGYIYEKPMSAEAARAKLSEGLVAIAKGPRAARETRQTMLRKVTLENSGQSYHGTIRNISAAGAMIEGLWNVPPGTIFQIQFGEGLSVTATTRWCSEDRLGMEFASPLALDADGRIAALTIRADKATLETSFRKAG